MTVTKPDPRSVAYSISFVLAMAQRCACGIQTMEDLQERAAYVQVVTFEFMKRFEGWMEALQNRVDVEEWMDVVGDAADASDGARSLLVHLHLLRNGLDRGAKIALLNDVHGIYDGGGVLTERAVTFFGIIAVMLGMEDGRHEREPGSDPARRAENRKWTDAEFAAAEKSVPQGKGEAQEQPAPSPTKQAPPAERETNAEAGACDFGDRDLRPKPLLFSHVMGYIASWLVEVCSFKGEAEDAVKPVVQVLFLWYRLAGVANEKAVETAVEVVATAFAWRLSDHEGFAPAAFCISVLSQGLDDSSKRTVVKILADFALESAGDVESAKRHIAMIAVGLGGDLEGLEGHKPVLTLRGQEVAQSVIAAAEGDSARIRGLMEQIAGIGTAEKASKKQGRKPKARTKKEEPEVSEPDPPPVEQFESKVSESGAVRLELQSRGKFNYAMFGAQIPLVVAVTLRNDGSEVIQGAVLALRVRCAASDEDLASIQLQIPDLEPGKGITIERPELRFDSRILVQLDESVAGEIDVTLRRDEEAIQQLHLPIRVLAYNQWTFVDGLEELLACHVVPNHPLIEEVRDTASKALRANTGSSSQEGYQAGGERALAIAKGNYQALQQLGIQYSNPPAGSEESQKVRTPDQILGAKFGTCLDTACLMAACLEQAGLHPVLFVISGHALVGVWLEEKISAKSPNERNHSQVMSLIEGKHLLPIETTCIASDKPVAFEEAVAEGRRRLAQSTFRCMIDIRRARHEGLRALPSRILENGKVTVVHQAASGPAVTIQMGQRRVQAAGPDRGPIPKRFGAWQRDLLDLSLRNPLLNIKIGRGGGVRICMPAESIADVERALCSEHGLQLVAHDQLSEIQRKRGARFASEIGGEMLRNAFLQHESLFVEVEEQKLRSRLRQLMNQARTMEEESGANILHLSIGSVAWEDPEKGKKVRSPLLVLPVRLTLQGRGKPPLMQADLSTGGTMVNQCLLQKLSQAFRMEVPEVAAWRGDREDADIHVVLRAMREAIQREGISASVDEDAALCLLHFGKFRMWKDLHEHWPEFMKQPVVRHFVEKAGQNYEDSVAPPTRADLESADVCCPIPIDGSQLEAVVAAARGCSFVLEGPPGTGKSQTITNLVANALAAGKKILFVAEKRAALEVVKTRLNKVGLGVYCLDIHGKTSKPQELRTQLMRSLEAQFSTDLGAFEKRRRELSGMRSELQQYAERLHEKDSLGHSLWSARQAVLACGEGPRFDVPAGMFAQGAAALEWLREALRQMRALATSAGLQPRHPWGFVDAADLSAEQLPRIEAAVSALRAVHAKPCPSLDRIASVDAMRAVVAIASARVSGAAIAVDALRAAKSGASAIASLESELAALRSAHAAAAQQFRPSLFEQDVTALADALEKAKKSFFLFRGGRVRKAEAAIAPHLASPMRDSTALLAALRAVQRLDADGDALTAKAQKIASVALPAAFSVHRPDHAALLADILIALRCGSAALDGAHESVVLAAAQSAQPSAADVEAMRARAAAWQSMWDAVGAKSEEVDRWLARRTLSEAAAQSMALWTRDADKARFLDLGRWTKLQQKLAELSQAGFGPMRRALLDGTLPVESAMAALDRSLAHASLEDRMRSLGFERFDGKAHNGTIQRFAEENGRDAAALAEVLPVRLQGTRPFRPGQRVGRVGDLVRNELMRTKGGKSIRALMEDYAEAIITLTPCVLASPDSVAQFLTPGVIEFDLVVFDEASQVPVADAIGAIGRGKSVVVVGDSRQMPPTAFFSRSSGGGDEEGQEEPEEEMTEDMESILSESVASGLARIWLSWHYRSQDESLIAFSNRHYYESRLASFPSPASRDSGKGLSWIKVEDAVFDSGETRTNEKEAEAVVREVRRRLADPVESKRSMGIVTMNLTQAELVRELLERCADEDPAIQRALEDESDERMFIKNLENVQGDERDVILISLTYARSPQGKLLMNFGPLGKVGGERRWNVLVTRAKQQVVVVSSMEPEDIKVERISAHAKGVHHMRAYMEMCKRGVERATDIQVRPVEDKDRHREQVAAALRARGLVVEANIGLSTFKVDLSIAHASQPDRRLVAILLDGPGYADRKTVEDREALPAAVLQKMMGWPKVLRIWLPEWLLEEARVVDEIVAAVEETQQMQRQADLLQGAPKAKPTAAPMASLKSAAPVANPSSKFSGAEPEPTVPLPAVERPAHDLLAERVASRMSQSEADAYLRAYEEATAEQLRREAIKAQASVAVASAAAPAARDPEDRDYVPYADESLAGSKDHLDPDAPSKRHGLIRTVIDQVLSVESPIESSRLAKLVARRFGLQRVREDRVQFILGFVDASRLIQSELGSFVWASKDQRTNWREFRRTPSSLDGPRPFDEIAPEEIRNALVYCAIKGMGLSDEGALAEVAEIFGLRRITQDARARIAAVTEWSIRTGALQRDAKGRIVAGEKR